MRKIYLALAMVFMLVLSGCSGDDVGTSTAKLLDTPLNAAEARANLQTWVDGHLFDSAVTIGDGLTDENDTGFVYTLFQGADELARIRIIKNTGVMLHHNVEKDQYVSIDDWYKHVGDSVADTTVAPTESDSGVTATATPAPTNSSAPTESSPSPTPTTSAPATSDNSLLGKAATIKSGQDFSEDRAFVTYSMWLYKGKPVEAVDADTILGWFDSGKDKDVTLVEKYALIDTQGNIIWETDTAPRYASGFTDGLAHFGNSDTDFSIIDTTGKITYTQKSGYKLLGYGGGKFVVAQHVSNFNADEWQIGAIDKNGKVVVPLEPIAIPTNDYDSGGQISFDEVASCEYLGSGVFRLGSKHNDNFVDNLANIEKHKVILSLNQNDLLKFYTDFEPGYAIVSVGYPKSYNYEDEPVWNGHEFGLYKMGTDGNLTESLGDCWIPNDLVFSDGLTFLESFNEYVYDDKISGAYYDMYGKLAIDFPDYRGKRSYFCGSFLNGYAPMRVAGADGKYYYTIIDKTGKQMFEPKSGINRLSMYDGYALTFYTENPYEPADRWSPKPGEAHGNAVSVLNMKGEAVLSIVGQDISTMYMSRNPDPYTISCSLLRIPSVRLGDGKGDVYVNIADGSVIGGGAYKLPITIIKH